MGKKLQINLESNGKSIRNKGTGKHGFFSNYASMFRYSLLQQNAFKKALSIAIDC